MHATLNPPIRVGLIGFGLAGASFHAPLLAALPAFELVHVISSQPAQVHARFPQARVSPEADALWQDAQVDLVVIAAPNALHFPLAQAALRAGKHVVVDKPFVLDSLQARSLIGLARQRGLLLSVFHNRRWDGDFLALRALLQEGRLGQIHTFSSQIDRYRPQVRPRWREQDVPGGGLLYDLGPHLLDQVLQLFGRPQALFADLAQQRAQAETTDYLHLLLYYSAQPALRVSVRASCLMAAPTPRFEVHGSAGSWRKYGMDGQEDALRAGLQPLSQGWHVAPESATLHDAQGQAHTLPLPPGNWCEYYAGIAAALRSGQPPPVSAESALEGIVLLEAALQSARSRAYLELDEAMFAA